MALVASEVVISPGSPIQFTLGSMVALAALLSHCCCRRLASLQCGPASMQHHMPTVAGEPHGARTVQRHCYQLPLSCHYSECAIFATTFTTQWSIPHALGIKMFHGTRHTVY